MYVFDIEHISLMDINELIDKGVRFCLASQESGKELMDVEDYLNEIQENILEDYLCRQE